MQPEQKRKNYVIANEFQREILMPALIANTILILVVTILLFYIILDLVAKATGAPRFIDAQQARIAGMVIFGIVLFSSTILITWCYRVSHRFAGPLVRINRELQAIIDGKRGRDPITLRKNDYLKDLVDKINEVIKKTGGFLRI